MQFIYELTEGKNAGYSNSVLDLLENKKRNANVGKVLQHKIVTGFLSEDEARASITNDTHTIAYVNGIYYVIEKDADVIE